MFTFLFAVFLLFAGYYVYGRIVERIFGIEEDRKTPAIQNADGIDYVEVSKFKSFLIQLLNIAGVGPIFGAVAGALWGPAAFLWIVFGTIFGGAVHDYLAGMISLRHKGETVGEFVRHYLGKYLQQGMRIFSLLLLIIGGTVLTTSPADILKALTGIDKIWWLVLIIAYYVMAAILPLDKLITKVYPIFGFSLLIMCIGIGVGIFFLDKPMPELTLENMHPREVSFFPFLFVSIACGAISGGHALTCPLTARCIRTEKDGRRVFYGAMVAEGLIALIWAAAAIAFFGSSDELAKAGSAAAVVSVISQSMLGSFGGILVIVGVVACSITSGDTVFRVTRLTFADMFNIPQQPIKNRLFIVLPLFAISTVLCFVDFAVIWRYFTWSNQVVAVVMLWTGAVYLSQRDRFHWIATVPAVFMTAAVTSYLLVAPEGFRFAEDIGIIGGIISATTCFVLFIRHTTPQQKSIILIKRGVALSYSYFQKNK